MTTVLAVAPTHAEPARDRSARARALALNHRAKELYDHGDYAEAAALLREAYRQKAEPVLQYNLARACEKIGDHACAVAAYERYLESDPRDRADVEARLASSRARLAPAPVPGLPRPDVPPAVPAADPAVPADSPVPADPAARPSPLAGPVPRDPPRSLGPPIVGAVGAAGIGVGLALMISARARSDAAVQDPTQQGARRRYESAVSRMRAGAFTLVGGGVVAASGLVWWILDVRSRRTAASSSAPSASAISFTRDSIVFSSRF